MKNTFIAAIFVSILAIAACKKDSTNNNNNKKVDATLEQNVINSFATTLANPNYQDIQAKALIMNNAIQTLSTSTTEANLAAARTAWKNTRAAWESCEGFLFGPVEDFNYDPDMDDWPVNKVDLDSLLSSPNPLTVNDITPLGTTLKGFHAIEYVIFGVGGTRKAADITAREKTYIVSLAQSLYNTTTQLRNSWDPSQANNFTTQVETAGKGSTTFATRKDFFLVLLGSMADICNEVANEKMQTPFAAQDSTLDESSFSHNSVTDFKNNITGILNAYKCQYNGASGQYSLSTLVAANNKSLDNTLQSQMNAAIASFSQITTTYEKAIYTQQQQVKNVQNTINTLKASLDQNGPLYNYIVTYVKD